MSCCGYLWWQWDTTCHLMYVLVTNLRVHEPMHRGWHTFSSWFSGRNFGALFEVLCVGWIHYKKDTSVTFWAERKKILSYIWHFYDDNCDKTRYHHWCGGLLLLWQKFMTKNELFVQGGIETQLHDILWAVHDEKTVVEARARKISRCSRLRWVVGAERCALLSYTYTRVCEALALTEAEQCVGISASSAP